MATSKARPVLASQAEKVNKNIGADEKLVAPRVRAHREKDKYRDSIMPSKHRRAESRWVRLKDNPANPKMKAEKKEKLVRVIRLLWT